MIDVPRPGGEADKLGNKYEGAWAIRHVLYCIVESTHSLTAEDIHEDLGQGSEFTYTSDGITEVHQVKRQHGNNNYWSIKALVALGIFKAATKHVAEGRRYHFVSLIPCGPLKELAERARQSADVNAFTQSWLTDNLRTAFDQLSAAEVLGNAHAAWNTLRGMWFEVHDEGDVIRVNSMLAERSLEGATGHVISLAIGDVLLDNLGKRLTRTEILQQLGQHGITPLTVGARATAHEQICAVTGSWSTAVQRDLLQPPIERDEGAQLTEVLKNDRLGLILGTAGGGKSSVLSQAVASLKASGAEVLALRLDRVEPFASTSDLGRQLGLDMSPAAALALAADGRDAYLVLDQLDAVSLASGRMPQSFDVIMDLIGEALAVSSVRVILACREFDVENDHRIRALAGRSDMRKVQVGLLSTGTAKLAVERMGLDPTLLTASQLALLQTPLHLVLLSGIAGQSDALSFQSKSSLFAAFWEHKRRAARGKRQGVRFNDTLARVANAASDRQTLSVPMEVLDEDDLLDDANVLISEHVLAQDGDRIAFFHESFFDYAFARLWVSRGESLVKFLLRDEQELFRRAQVRQILQHLREREPERFLQELETLLTNEEIRFHIKDTALAVFGDLTAPTTAEVDLALRVASTKPPWEDRLWQQLRRAQWFNRFHIEGVIDTWLDSEDGELRERAINLMLSGAKEQSDDVAGLLEARSTDPDYHDWLRWVLRAADIHTHRRLFELFLAAVRDGAYDEVEQELWFSVHELAKQQPLWAVELLQARLVDHVNALALNAEGKIGALSTRDYGASELVQESAAAEPRAFVETIVPYLLSVMAATEYQMSDHSCFYDRHFTYRLPDNDRYDREIDDALLTATTRSLQALVRSESEAIRPMLERLAEDVHEAAQFLLYRALAAGNGKFSDWAAELLLQGGRRLDCGYMSDGHWVAREVVKAIAPHVDDAVHRQLEEKFRDLRNPYERGQSFGRTAFTFLSALEERRLSMNGARRLQEYRRKFSQSAPSAPQGIVVGTIGSPIGADAMTKMTDSQWLDAMAKHDRDGHNWDTLKGGARELAHLLRAQIPVDPGRFARLALHMAADLNPTYGDAILMGFGDPPKDTDTDTDADADADADSVFAAIMHIASFGHPDNDRWLGTALRQHLRDAPLELVELVLDRTLHSTHPTDHSPAFVPSNGDARRADSLHQNGINTTRGSLAESLGDLLVYDADGERTEIVRPHLNKLAADPVLSVRTCVAHTIAASLRHARPAAYAAFERLIESDDAILAAEFVKQLMLYIGNVNPEVIDPVIQRMLSSQDEEAREAGGQLAVFAALEWERPELLAQALDADAPVRRGAAHMSAARLVGTSNTELATAALLQFLGDRDDDVRKTAAEVASNLREYPLRPFAALLEGLIDSPSYEHATPQLLITLEHAPDKVDDLVLRAARRFLTVYGEDARDIRTSAAGYAHYVSELVVRGLAQSRDRAHRTALLDVLDLLLELGVYGIGEAIAESERL